MSKAPEAHGLRPDDALPPVEPPSAGFIVQLFVVPGVIVFVVVMIWVMFHWLAQKGNDPDAFVRALSRNNEARWQAAFNLAHELRQERKSAHPQLSTNPELAGKLANVLDREIQSGSMDDNSVELRIYLCRALGEFRVTSALPTLIKAASTQRSDSEAEVRRSAIEGIAVLAANVPGESQSLADNDELAEALLAASADSDPRTRRVAAVAMGVVGGQRFQARLQRMLVDSDPDVRYNAAARLANAGDEAAVEVLIEMLDPNELAGVNAEKQETAKAFKRALITINALRASGQLAEKNRDADLKELRTAIDELIVDQRSSPETRVEATDVLRRFDHRSSQ